MTVDGIPVVEAKQQCGHAEASQGERVSAAAAGYRKANEISGDIRPAGAVNRVGGESPEMGDGHVVQECARLSAGISQGIPTDHGHPSMNGIQ
jgi:hypothetical protein